MKTYRIQNVGTGVDLGVYEAENANNALEALAC